MNFLMILLSIIVCIIFNLIISCVLDYMKRGAVATVTTRAYQERKGLEAYIDAQVDRAEIGGELPEAERRAMIMKIILSYLAGVKTRDEYDRALTVLKNMSPWDLSEDDKKIVIREFKAWYAKAGPDLNPKYPARS